MNILRLYEKVNNLIIKYANDIYYDDNYMNEEIEMYSCYISKITMLNSIIDDICDCIRVFIEEDNNLLDGIITTDYIKNVLANETEIFWNITVDITTSGEDWY